MTQNEILTIYSKYYKERSLVAECISDYFFECRKIKEEERKHFIQENAQTHPLETMVYMDVYENEHIYEWMKEFYWTDNTLEMYGKLIQRKTRLTMFCLQFLLIMMKHLEGQELETVAKLLFSDENRREDRLFLSARRMSEIYAQKLEIAFKTMPGDCYLKEAYLKIIPAILKARNMDYHFINDLEHGMRHECYSEHDKIIIGKDALYQYYVTLCNAGLYDAASNFLMRMWNKEEDLFGWSKEQCIENLYSAPSPRIAYFGYSYIREREPEYTEEEWCKSVLERNPDENTRIWMDLYMFYQKMWLYAKEGDYANVIAMADSCESVKMFDFEKCSYMTKMISRMAEIMNCMLLENQDIEAFLKKIERINVYSYLYNKYAGDYVFYYRKKLVPTEEECQRIKEKFLEVADPETLLYIYMNSNLKMLLDIRDVMEHMRNQMEVSNSKLKWLLAKYPIHGIVTRVSERDAFQNRIHVDPFCPYTKWTYSYGLQMKKKERGQGPLTNEAFSKTFRNQEEWCRNHMDTAELFRKNDKCEFYISGYDQNELIYVYDLKKEDYSEDESDREEFPEYVRGWLEIIRQKKQMRKWGRDVRCFYMMNVKSKEERNRVVIDILKTILVLKENKHELEKFVTLFYSYPTETINEFRYIQTNHFNRFDIREIEEEAKELGEQILNAQEIPSYLKLMIYQNTCLKKVCKLEDVCDLFGLGLYSKRFIFPLQIDEITSEGTRMRADYSNSVIKSDYSFYYCGEDSIPMYKKPKEKRKAVYSVSLERVDHENRRFYIREVYIKNTQINQWAKFVVTLNDFKRQSTPTQFDAIAQEINKFSVEYSTEDRIRTYTDQLDRIFQSCRFDGEFCSRVLDALGEKNFYAKEIEKIDRYMMSETEKATYRESYEAFINANSESAYQWICYIYYRSYFKKVVSEEEFFVDLERSGKNMQKVKKFCIKEGFCTE